MKKLFLIVLFVFCLTSISLADKITLNTAQQLSVTEGISLDDWEIIKINQAQKIMQIKYRWRDQNGNIIYTNSTRRNGFNIWTCSDFNIADNSVCVAQGDPYDCCTGSGEGNCNSNCFTDVFNFSIRSQDVGTSIGVGLRSLIKNKMLPEVAPDTTGDFE